MTDNIIAWRDFVSEEMRAANIHEACDDAANEARTLAHPLELGDLVDIRLIDPLDGFDNLMWRVMFTFSTREPSPAVKAARRNRETA